ncbi:transposase [Burkholderia vietnamiensis]|nr:transposase [Burkholderia vietnamiensis]MDN8071335.1 transposase [Burkholderia vietnamiensis]
MGWSQCGVAATARRRASSPRHGSDEATCRRYARARARARQRQDQCRTPVGVYVRDDRASGDATPPAVWFAYTPDRRGIHPQQHLASFNGTLHGDAYRGYQAIYETGRVAEAACWAHARRQFYELHAARPNALNTEALERIGALYKVEEQIRGKPPDERRAYRQAQARPLLDHLHTWLTATLEALSRTSDTSRAIQYALNRREALTHYCDDGRLEIDNPSVERARGSHRKTQLPLRGRAEGKYAV